MPHYITKEGLEELKKEHEDLVAKRSEISQRIQEAKELGDLSENADYTDAKEAQAFNEGRIAELEAIIKDAEIVKEGKSDVVRIGSTVDVQSSSGDEHTFLVTGASEANPAEGKISNESPIGKALLGTQKGDETNVQTPGGTVTYTIKKVR